MCGKYKRKLSTKMINKHDNGIRKTIATIGDDLEFDEPTHTYKYKGEVFTSVTTVLKPYFPFDADGVATKLGEIKYGKYKDMDKEQVLAAWAAKRDSGTARHLFCENFLNGNFVSIEHELDLVAHRYIRNMNIQDVLTEVQIAHPALKVSGMIDALVKINGKWYIYDWKTDAAVRKESYDGEQCPGVLMGFDNCNYNKYMFQLSIYKYILEDVYDITISGLVVVHLTSTHAVEYKLPYQIDYVGLILNQFVKKNQAK